MPLPRTNLGTRCTPEEHREMIERYKRGESLRAIASAMSRSYGMVHWHVKNSDEVEMRQRVQTKDDDDVQVPGLPQGK